MRRLMILLSSLLIPSCLKTEIIGYDSVAIDTIVVKSHKPHKPHNPPTPTEKPDTAKVPMGFSPSVTDWEVIETPTNL